jgi:hypothetical protein
MKYIITESKLEDIVIRYLNEIFTNDEINQMSPYVYDEETGIEGDDETRIEFYIGDYDDGDNNIFRWYDCEYFNKGAEIRQRCPIIHLEDKYSTTLNGFFGDMWVEPFKKWFTINYNLPVKTVEWM